MRAAIDTGSKMLVIATLVEYAHLDSLIGRADAVFLGLAQKGARTLQMRHIR